MNHCPCNPTKQFADCCGPFLSEGKSAPTPETLMRSRFSAYATGGESYLLSTWHPSTRPQGVATDLPHWLGLQIIRTSVAGEGGIVEFKATYKDGLRIGVLHETSRFRREQGVWLYVDGVLHESGQKAGRNDPCPCGSGRKFKRCCG